LSHLAETADFIGHPESGARKLSNNSVQPYGVTVTEMPSCRDHHYKVGDSA
jgi:hypothetical protein